jgi:hypothetical protein
VTARPSCRWCGRAIIRALTAGAVVVLDVEPSPHGRFEIDLDVVPPRARRWRGAEYSTASTPERLYRRHFETCPKWSKATGDEAADVVLSEDQLLEQRDRLAAALDQHTHEFTREDDESDLCVALTPHRCGLVHDHPKHRTSAVVLADLTPRAATGPAHTTRET